MLQAMLADRFRLTYHRENREYPMTVSLKESCVTS